MLTGISFLQSKEWGEFQTAAGYPAVRFDSVTGFTHRPCPGMRYLYIPRYATDDSQYLDTVFNHFAKRGFVFLRIEPVENISSVIYRLSPTPNRQPRHTLIVHVSKTEEELLAGFHPKTRYNIHLAERHGVVVREEKNIEIFWRLHEATSRRDRFRGHQKAYYEKMLAMPMTHQITAYAGETPIASDMLIVFDGTCTYLHGASSNEQRNLMAPYLLQWEGMKLAKRLGCDTYDLWGVAPPGSNPTHSWSGITRFKAGFGGTPVSYPQAVDVVLSPFRYRIYRAARRARDGIITI